MTLLEHSRRAVPTLSRLLSLTKPHQVVTTLLAPSYPRSRARTPAAHQQSLSFRAVRRYTSAKQEPSQAYQTVTMASDEDYMAFLNKANQDTSNGHAATTQKTQPATFKTKDVDSRVPEPIRAACSEAVYVSDADEPFVGVSLKWDGDGLPDEVEFAKLIEHWDPENADVDILDPVDWDAKGAYTKVIDAVREATRGNDVRVYRVTRDKTRAEYWVVSSEQGKIVGAKALSVET